MIRCMEGLFVATGYCVAANIFLSLSEAASSEIYGNSFRLSSDGQLAESSADGDEKLDVQEARCPVR